MNQVSVTEKTDLNKYTIPHILDALMETSYKNNMSYACWRLPSDHTIYFTVDFSGGAKIEKISLEQSVPGYIVHPFEADQERQGYFIKSDLLFNAASKEITLSMASEQAGEKFIKEFHLHLEKDVEQYDHYYTSDFASSDHPSEAYKEMVTEASEAIAEERFKKVVLARRREINVDKNINIAEIFTKVCEQYPVSFISFISSAYTGSWLTASPETLVSIDKNNIFRTVALAGTQRLNEGDKISQTVWTQKEIEEQALVARYIINCFKSIRIREYDDIGPRTIKAGELAHLRTDFSVNIKEVNFPELGSVMLDLLHPTSAVCGMPKAETLDFIKKHEGFKREFFSGYLGPVNIHHESHIFVNLRCAKLSKGKALLYAGAGIIADSDPEKELAETELKMETIGRFLSSK